MSMFGGCQARAARRRRGGPTFPLPSRFGPTRFAVSIYRFHLNAREVLIRQSSVTAPVTDRWSAP
eukprot:COSAG03_NODE_711_length_6158_cov_95.789734_6_plen_65_part_00